MHNRILNLSAVAALTLMTASCTRLFKNEAAPPPPKPMKGGLISPAEGAPIEEPWAQSIGEGIYKVGKPYKVNGVWYFPKEDYNYDEVGYASWYGPDFHNKRTANGEIFDMNMLSAAHKTLPLPSVIRVTNLQNGRSLILRVNDRGPFVNDRILDVSRKGAQLLGFKDQGTTKIRVELLPEESMTVASLAQNAGYISPDKIKPAEAGEVTVTDDLQTLESFGDPNESPVGKSLPGATLADAEPDGLFDGESVASVSRKESTQDTSIMSEEDYNRQLEASLRAAVPQNRPQTPEATMPQTSNTYAPAKPVTVEPPAPVAAVGSGKIYVQAGAFGRPENAQKVSQKLQTAGPTIVHQIDTARGPLYKVKVGPFNSKSEAQHALSQVLSSGHPDAHLISDS